MRDLHVIVSNKIATYLGRDGSIVCGNSDYQIVFTFDSEWDGHTEKVARFIWNSKYHDVPFTGNTVTVPVLTNTTQVIVGVYAGDLHTTTPALIACEKSILCGTSEEKPLLPSQYEELTERLNETVKTVNGIAPDENGNVEVEGGLSDTAKTLLVTILRNAVFTSDQSANITALEQALASSGEGEEEPDVPDEPDEPVTLTSISVTYSGGDVAVGTAVTALTGVSVTAHYSDGSTATVTGYTLSGTIAEGENTITVSYQGKTATFTVNGIAESTGENNGWIDGQAYELNKVDCLKLDTTTGETAEAESGTMVTDFLPCLGVSAVSYEAFDSASILNTVMYDENKNFIKANGLLQVADPTQDNANTYLALYNVVPEGTAYLRFTQRSSIKYLTSVTPHKYPVLTETTERETGRWYESGAVLGYLNANDGTFVADGTWYVTGHCMVYGASKVHFSQGTRKTVVFYDGNKNYISGTTINNTTTFEIPENAVYMAASSGDMNNLHIWLEV